MCHVAFICRAQLRDAMLGTLDVMIVGRSADARPYICGPAVLGTVNAGERLREVRRETGSLLRRLPATSLTQPPPSPSPPLPRAWVGVSCPVAAPVSRPMSEAYPNAIHTPEVPPPPDDLTAQRGRA